MSLILKKHVKKDCLLGLWEITEDYNTLFSCVDLNDTEINTLTSYKNQNRKLEFLSVRTLLSHLVDEKIKIIYNHNSKPFFNNHLYNISISHSRKLTSILLSKTRKVGVDLEFMSDRIYKISHKFIHNKEQITENTNRRINHLYIHWCAKEAIYKLLDRKNLNFSREIFIKPFTLRLQGKIEGIVEIGKIYEKLELNYFQHNNYIIVWCCKE